MDLSQVEKLLDVKLVDTHDNWKCLCPFHEEETPSFFIHKTEYMCHCFGCGIAGFIDFLIAKKQGLLVSEVRALIDIDNSIRPMRKEVHEHVTIFPESWLAPWPRQIHHYLLERGFTVDVLKMAETRFDASARRQVFPIRDEEGNLVGATGRSVANQDPKWFHYWNYQKGTYLYYPSPGTSPLCIVEGPLDALWLTQHGWHACAIFGSRPSSRQIDLIKRKASTVILALDNDDAGHKGAEELHDKLKGTCSVEYAVLPSFANDVCDLSAKQLEEVLTNTKNLVQLSVQSNREIN